MPECGEEARRALALAGRTVRSYAGRGPRTRIASSIASAMPSHVICTTWTISAIEIAASGVSPTSPADTANVASVAPSWPGTRSPSDAPTRLTP